MAAHYRGTEAVTDNQQGDLAWFTARYGKVTMSSGINTLMHGGAVAKNTLLRGVRDAATHTPDKILELYQQSKSLAMRSAALAWGHDTEGKAVSYYELTRHVKVVRPGFVVHPKYRWCGGSPDFLESSSEEGPRLVYVGEIKCPVTPEIHLQYLKYRVLVTEHYNQIQGNIAITNSDAGKFLSFDPRQKLESDILSVVNVPLDHVWQEKFAQAAQEFDTHLRNGTNYENQFTKAVDGLPSMF